MDLLKRTTSAATGSPRLRVLFVALGIVAVLVVLAVTIDPASSRSTSERSGDSDVSGRHQSTVPQLVTSPRTSGSLASSDVAATGGPTAPGAREAKATGTGAIDALVTAPDAASTTSSGSELPAIDAKVLRTADVTVRVKRGTFDKRWAEATRLAEHRGGYISDSNLSTYGNSAPRSGTITLKVPADRFDDTIADLRALGTVTALDQSSQDVTQDYVDTRSRLRHDRAVETQLLGLLSRAKSIDDTLTIQDRLNAVQQQIEVETGRVQYLDKMTSYSTLSLRLQETGAATHRPKPRHESWGIHTAVHDAAHRASANVASAIVWFGGAAPTLLVLTLLLAAGRVLVVRRRARRDRGSCENETR